MTLSVVRPSPLPAGRETGIALLSDLHLGSPDADVALFQREVREAVARGDRVALGGDVFDLILAKDVRRYKPSEVHPRLAGRDDLVNAAVDWAEEVLGPYADNIDFVGQGNHESASVKHNSFDATDLLVRRLQARSRPEHVVHHGGYSGFLQYGFEGLKCRHTLFFWHGSGGGSGLGGALGEFAAKGSFLEGCDSCWFAHRHCRVVSQVEKVSCPKKGRKLVKRPVWLLRSGSYLDGLPAGPTQRNGRRSSYAAEALLTPYGRGGLRLVLCPDPRGGTLTSRVEVCS